MDYTTLAEFLSTFGFPVVMCGALFWYMVTQNKQHAEESKNMTEAINDLKIAIIQLCDRIGGKDV